MLDTHNMKKLIIPILACITLASCATDPTASTVTKHTQTTGAGFTFERPESGQKANTQYAISYQLKDLNPGQYTLVAKFEHPVPTRKPYITTKTINYTKPTEVILKSPVLAYIQNNRLYTVDLELHSGTATGPLIDKNTQKLRFNVPTQLLKHLNLATKVE